MPDIGTDIQFCQNIRPIFDQNIIFSITDIDGNIISVSDAFCKETGYERKGILGKTHSFLRAPKFPNHIYDDLWNTITQDKIWKGEINNLNKDGESHWVSSVIQPIFDDNHKKIAYISIRKNITKEKKCEALSHIDELTGSYNRRKFNIEINKFLINFHRYNDNFSLIMIDIDHFKNFNDEFGHLVGDEIIKRVCNAMKKNIRESDLFSRWGGEEFILVLNKVDKEMAINASQKLLNIIKSDLCLYLHEKLNITKELTCSMGITSPKKSDSVDSLIQRVDSALYLAKDGGRNRVEIL